jgi:hypothetical protein
MLQILRYIVRVDNRLLPGGLPVESGCLGRETRGLAGTGVVTLTGDCSGLGLTVLSSIVLAVLLVTGVAEQNPGPGVEAENTIQLVCTECGKNLKSGIQCELCGSWYHYGCLSVKVQMAEREKWSCEKCKTERFLKLQEDLQNALRQIDDLKFRNRELQEKLLLVKPGRGIQCLLSKSLPNVWWLVIQCCALLELNTQI